MKNDEKKADIQTIYESRRNTRLVSVCHGLENSSTEITLRSNVYTGSQKLLSDPQVQTRTEVEARTIKEIMEAITAAGYEPYSQLYGYITTGKDEYITRRDNAREKIKTLNWLQLKAFVEKMDPN